MKHRKAQAVTVDIHESWTRGVERQAFIDQAAIALHAHGAPLANVFRRATELWDARVAWLKAQGAASVEPASVSGRQRQTDFSMSAEQSGGRP